MSGLALVFMTLVCGVIWGGFVLFLARMAWRERQKAVPGGDGGRA